MNCLDSVMIHKEASINKDRTLANQEGIGFLSIGLPESHKNH